MTIDAGMNIMSRDWTFYFDTSDIFEKVSLWDMCIVCCCALRCIIRGGVYSCKPDSLLNSSQSVSLNESKIYSIICAMYIPKA